MPGCCGNSQVLDRSHSKKLHRLTGPTPLGVSAPTGMPRDVDAKAEGQRPADAGAVGQRSESQRSEGQRGLESESGGPRPAGQDLSWRINRSENPIVFSIAFSLSIN